MRTLNLNGETEMLQQNRILHSAATARTLCRPRFPAKWRHSGLRISNLTEVRKALHQSRSSRSVPRTNSTHPTVLNIKYAQKGSTMRMVQLRTLASIAMVCCKAVGEDISETKLGSQKPDGVRFEFAEASA